MSLTHTYMSIIAEFTIPAEALPGGKILAEMPQTVLELERIVPTKESAFPFFWVWSDDVDTFIQHTKNEDEIADIEVLDTVDEGALVRATWTPEADLVHAIKALKATILEAEATATEWFFRIRTDEQKAVATFQNTFTAHEIPVTLNRVYDFSKFASGEQYELTPIQRETLLMAYEEGYYEKPREITQQELGARLNITSRAVSDQLRRGTANLIASTLLSTPIPTNE